MRSAWNSEPACGTSATPLRMKGTSGTLSVLETFSYMAAKLSL